MNDFTGIFADLFLAFLATLAVVRAVYWPLGRRLGISDPRNFRLWLLIPWRPIYRGLWMPARDWWHELTGYGRGERLGGRPSPKPRRSSIEKTAPCSVASASWVSRSINILGHRVNALVS